MEVGNTVVVHEGGVVGGGSSGVGEDDIDEPTSGGEGAGEGLGVRVKLRGNFSQSVNVFLAMGLA